MLAFNIDDILQWMNDTWQKLYISIPTILAFISAFGGTIIYKFAQLITNARAFYTTAKLLMQSNKKISKQLRLARRQQARFQKQVCETLKMMSKACLPNKRAEIISSIEKAELLIESDDVIDADYVEEKVEEVPNKKMRKIKVKKTAVSTNNNG